MELDCIFYEFGMVHGVPLDGVSVMGTTDSVTLIFGTRARIDLHLGLGYSVVGKVGSTALSMFHEDDAFGAGNCGGCWHGYLLWLVTG